MNYSNEVTQPKEQEVFWHCWPVGKNLSRDEALSEFKKIKPRDYRFERFQYDRVSGIARTV